MGGHPLELFELPLAAQDSAIRDCSHVLDCETLVSATPVVGTDFDEILADAPVESIEAAALSR